MAPPGAIDDDAVAPAVAEELPFTWYCRGETGAAFCWDAAVAFADAPLEVVADEGPAPAAELALLEFACIRPA